MRLSGYNNKICYSLADFDEVVDKTTVLSQKFDEKIVRI